MVAVLLGVSAKVLLMVVLLLMLLMAAKGRGSLTGKGCLVSSLLVRSLVMMLLLLLLSVATRSLMTVRALVRVHVRSVVGSLWWVSGNQLQRLLDLSWDWGRCGQMSSHGLESVLVGRVGKFVVLAVVTGVGEGSLNGNSRRVTDLLQMTLSMGRDSVAGLVAAEGMV